MNQARENPTVIDAASAVANMAQNMVMLANQKPEMAKQLETYVKTAVRLAEDISTNAPMEPKVAKAMLERVAVGLRTAVKESGITPADQNGNPIKLEEFIKERTKEVKAGIEARAMDQKVNKEPQIPTMPTPPDSPHLKHYGKPKEGPKK